MHIVIHAMGMPFNGDTINSGQSLGGSESACYYMSRELVRQGHQVTVFTLATESGVWDNVRYEWCGNITNNTPLGDRFHYVMEAPYDVLIIQRHPAGFIADYNTKVNVWWLHDLALYRTHTIVQRNMVNVDKIFTVSEYHRQQVSKVYDIEPEYVFASANGVDTALYKEFSDVEREPNSLLYAARPERGLENLVRIDGIMEKLPDCKLYVCSYENTTQQMQSYYNALHNRCKEMPNVQLLGSLGKRGLAHAMAKSMLYVYPTEFEDTSCILAMEAQACGTPVITSDIAALPETLKDAGALLLPLKDDRVNQSKFISTVERVLNDQSEWRHLEKKALAKNYDWSLVATQWVEEFEDILRKKSGNRLRMRAHMERMGDIIPLVKTGDDLTTSLAKNYRFVLNNTYEEHYKAYYEHEKEHGVIYGKEELRDNRYTSVLGKLLQFKPKRIMDYGCAHGHYTMNLASQMPDTEFVGVDIAESNIQTAKQWAIEDKVDDRCTFIKGTHDNLPLDSETNTFDLILVSEVLEHVPNPIEVVEELKRFLTPDGIILITVPYGAWEWSGIHLPKNVGWRAHIWHFERIDLVEMFGSQREYTNLAIPSGKTAQGDTIGHYLVTFKNTPTPCGEINLDRKMHTQAPKETVSLCMIVKDAENTIKRSLDSIELFVDEIIVGVDKTTTDETREILSAYKKVTWFEIDSPIEQGFDSARNQTVECAVMDWILWLDADETLENVHLLPQYLRNNCFNGYGVAQHHMAVEPLGCFRTDYPVRLFRNNLGIKFYGMVHEHPEIELNKSVGKILLLNSPHEVSIMHTGYSTERIRRQRFERNFPLMQKDREKHPDRTLGKFLWLRDLVHLCRYTAENNGHQVTEEMMQWCVEAIAVWDWLVKENHLRLAVDSLEFYSDAVKILTGNQGIDYAINLGASRTNGGVQLAPEPYKGKFLNLDAIKNLTTCLVEGSTTKFEDKYF